MELKYCPHCCLVYFVSDFKIDCESQLCAGQQHKLAALEIEIHKWGEDGTSRSMWITIKPKPIER